MLLPLAEFCTFFVIVVVVRPMVQALSFTCHVVLEFWDILTLLSQLSDFSPHSVGCRVMKLAELRQNDLCDGRGPVRVSVEVRPFLKFKRAHAVAVFDKHIDLRLANTQ